MGLGCAVGGEQELHTDNETGFHLKPWFWVPTVCETDSNVHFETEPWLKKRSTGPLLIKVHLLFLFLKGHSHSVVLDAGFPLLTCLPEVGILYHQAPRTVMVVAIFIENFPGPRMLLLLPCHCHCSYFPSMPTQERDVTCFVGQVRTVKSLTQQKELLVQRRADFCDGVCCCS